MNSILLKYLYARYCIERMKFDAAYRIESCMVLHLDNGIELAVELADQPSLLETADHKYYVVSMSQLIDMVAVESIELVNIYT